ncbi:hypothetical protein [Okeania sp. SIO2C9]|nr:hypothetical protein [Okeania sp. SIO2C9]
MSTVRSSVIHQLNPASKLPLTIALALETVVKVATIAALLTSG